MNVHPALARTLVAALLLALAACGAQPLADPDRATPPRADAAAAPAGTEAPAAAGEPEQTELHASETPPMGMPAPAPTPRVVHERWQQDMRLNVPPPAYVRGVPGYGPAPTSRDNYAAYSDNPIRQVREEPVSTFGLDVDTGSWTNVRRMLNEGRLPPADAVRAEEFINYFDYDYAAPADRERPFSVTTEVAAAPWNADRQLLLIGVQGWQVPVSEIPATNLVLLIDTSGSMAPGDRLPLLRAALRQLVPQLRAQDRIAIVTYAGSAGVALPATPGNEHARIIAAIDALEARGGTWGEAGLRRAYQEAHQGFIAGGVNRVLLATDGDFNIGETDIDALKAGIVRERQAGVALSILGVGSGNYNDALAVQLADAGNGSHHYIDNLREARRVLARELAATLYTIAGDAKVQVEFNPAEVREYRLIGYVKRMLAREDFNNDAVDAGDIGAGANVTALYEITRTGAAAPAVDPLRYGAEAAPAGRGNGELAWLRVRWKDPGQNRSRLLERAIPAPAARRAAGSERLRFAAAVAAFAEHLRGGTWLNGWGTGEIATLARAARGPDPEGERAEFIQLVELAGSLQPPGHDG